MVSSSLTEDVSPSENQACLTFSPIPVSQVIVCLHINNELSFGGSWLLDNGLKSPVIIDHIHIRFLKSGLYSPGVLGSSIHHLRNELIVLCLIIVRKLCRIKSYIKRVTHTFPRPISCFKHIISFD